MPAPVLLAVDDHPEDLGDVERELRGRYSADYRVICTDSPDEALATLTDLAASGDDVALVLAAQELSGAVGTDLLASARRLHPHAKLGLLLRWGTWAHGPTAEAVRDSMALGATDYYVLKPAAPPDELFHQTISSFLLDWSRDRRTAPHTIHIVGEAWSGRAYELRSALQSCAMPHAFCLADSAQGRDLIARAGPEAELPLLVLPDGRTLSNPSDREIAEADGSAIDIDRRVFDVVIVGAGPAGLCAAVSGASEGLATLVIDAAGVGGQASSSAMIRNYLGFPRGITGGRLAEQAYEQAWVFRATFAFMTRVTALGRSAELLTLTLADGRAITARTVVLATGATWRRLDVPELDAFRGAGVFYGGPVTEGPAMVAKHAFVLGGANSAGQAALHLARYARHVTVVTRAPSLDAAMSYYLVHQLDGTPNITVRTNSEVVAGGGHGCLQHVVLRDRISGDRETAPADGLFVLIGARPHTEWLPGDIARDADGFLLTGADVPDGEASLRPSLETSIPGVFAAGDVRHGATRRVASAVGEGSIAIQQVHNLIAADAGAGRLAAAPHASIDEARRRSPS